MGKEGKGRKGGWGKKEGENVKVTEWGGILGKKKKMCKNKRKVHGLLPRRKVLFWALLDFASNIYQKNLFCSFICLFLTR